MRADIFGGSIVDTKLAELREAERQTRAAKRGKGFSVQTLQAHVLALRALRAYETEIRERKDAARLSRLQREEARGKGVRALRAEFKAACDAQWAPVQALKDRLVASGEHLARWDVDHTAAREAAGHWVPSDRVARQDAYKAAKGAYTQAVVEYTAWKARARIALEARLAVARGESPDAPREGSEDDTTVGAD